MNFIVLINIIALLVLIGILYALKKKNIKFSTRVFIALGLGILLGAVLQFIYGSGAEEVVNTVPWYNIIGTGYVKLLQMIAMPLIFISILVAFTKMKVGKNFGKMAALILAILIGTTAISAAVGITTTAVFNLDATQILQGDAEVARGESLVERSESLAAASLPQQIVELFPANPFADLTGSRSTSTIAVVIFSAFLGFAYLSVSRRDQETAATIKKVLTLFMPLLWGLCALYFA